MRYRILGFLLAIAHLTIGQSIVITEVSQGTSGNMEFVEFLVTEHNSCSLDLRGYIFDDNNGDFGSGSGYGIATGAARFDPNNTFWSEVPIGTSITIYNDTDPPPGLPADDLSLTDGNCSLIIPISSALFEGHSSQPVSTGPNTYATGGWASGASWGDIQMGNDDDSFQIRANGSSSPIHAISWGNNASSPNAIITVSGGVGGQTVYFTNSLGNGDYFDQNNYSVGSAAADQTPGMPNSVNHAALLSTISGTCSSPLTLSIPTYNLPTCTTTGDVALSVSGGRAPYVNATTMPGGAPVNNGINNVFIGLTSGVYEFTVTDVNGCTVETTIDLFVDPPIIYTATAFALGTCSNTCDASYTFIVSGSTSVSGSTPSMTVTWDGPTPGSLITPGGNITLSNLCPGPYSITVTDGNGCDEDLTFTATVGTNATFLNNTTPGSATTQTSADGSVALGVSGATMGQTYQYSYQSPPNTGTITTTSSNPIIGLTAGNYSVTVTTVPMGCTDEGTFTIGYSQVNVSTQVVLGGTTLSAPYWVCPETNPLIEIYLNGVELDGSWTVSLVATSSNGAVSNVNQGYPAGVNVNDYPYTTITGTATDGSITINIPPVVINTYQNPISNWTPFATPLCQNAATISVSSPVVDGPNSYNGTFELIQSVGSVTLQGPGVSSVNIAPSTLTTTGGHLLIFTFQDNGCTLKDTFNFNVVNTADYSVADPSPFCDNDNTPYSLFNAITWNSLFPENQNLYVFTSASAGVSGSNFIPSTAGGGTHTITVSYTFNGCTVTDQFDITVDSSPDLSTLFTPFPPTVCSGSTLSLPTTPAGGTWSGSPGITGPTGAQIIDASGLSLGPHTLTYAENLNSCPAQVTITVENPPNFSYVETSIFCQSQGTYTLTSPTVTGGSGSGSESWQITGNPTPYPTIAGNTIDVSNISTWGPYTITYTYLDDNGCSYSENESFTVQADNPPSAIVNPLSVCSSDALDLTQSGYFSPLNGDIYLNGALVPSGIIQGSALTGSNDEIDYVITTNGCESSVTVPIDLSTPFGTSGPYSVSTTCSGVADATVAVYFDSNNPPSGFPSYYWSTGSFASSLTNVGPGTYTVTLSDNSGCQVIQSYTVTEPQAISGNSSITHVSSNGGSDGAIDLTVSGGSGSYTYLWSNGLPPTQNQSGLSAGTYSVTIVDGNGCPQFLSNLVVSQPGPLTASGAHTDVNCNGDNSGAINISVGGGFTPPDVPMYQFQWSHGETTEDVANLAAGQYSVTVTAVPTSTESQTLNFTITEPTVLSLSGTPSDVLCFGQSTGAITTTVSGGASPYTYEWSNNFAVANIGGLSAGSYSLTVTDDNGCRAIEVFTLTQPTNGFMFGFQTTAVDCYGDASGAIDLTMDLNGATPPFTFLWSNGATTEDLTNIPAGLYTVVITDDVGCTVTLPAPVITQPANPLAIVNPIVVTDVANYGAGDGSVSYQVSGGTQPYTYQWQGPSGPITGNNSITGLDGGNYYTTVIDANGCTSTAFFTVNEPGLLTLSGTVTDETCLGTADGSIDLTVSANGTPTYVWSNGATTEDLSGLAVGMYSVTVVDAPQIDTAVFYVSAATILDFNLSLPADTFCTQDTLFLSGTTTNTGATETYKIDGQVVTGTFELLSGYALGPHTLTYVVSAGGCTDSVSVGFELVEPYLWVPQSSVQVCTTGSTVNLTSLLNAATIVTLPDTGRWADPTGASVSSTMDPTVGPFGVYDYSISNYCGEVVYQMDVSAIQNPIVFSTPDSICQSGGTLDLNTLVTPTGGTWAGGTTTGIFDPSVASPSPFWFFYTTTLSGCTFTDSIQIQVVANPVVTIDSTAIPALCTAQGSDTLSFGQPVGGIYTSSTAVIGQAGTSFVLDPAASGAGVHDIAYTYTDPSTGCFDSIVLTLTIDATVATAIGPFADTLCVGDAPVPLPVSLPAGGILTGPGISGGNFSPAAAGVGTHQLLYSFPGDPCYIADSIEVVVTDVPAITMPVLADICSSDPALTLTGATPAGGTWIGNIVVNGLFLPGIAGPGVHDIVYYYNSGGACENYDTTQITVLAGSPLSIGTVPGFCSNGSAQPLSCVSPNGGTYSGPGVQSNVFSPQIAGVGSHSITYTYTNLFGCVTDTIFNIQVNDVPAVTVGFVPDFCQENPPAVLDWGVPGGGYYSGPGVVNDSVFDPGMTGPGSFICTYTYVDPIGCTASLSVYIDVHPTPPTPGINKTLNFLVCDWGFYHYQWFFDGDSIPNSNTIKWTATDTGYYQVMLINEWGCTNISDSLLVSVIYATDLSEEAWQNLVMCPNPTRDLVYVELPIRPQAVKYQWVNAMGQVVDEGELPAGDPMRWRYDMTHLADGYYTFVLRDSERVLHFRMLLQR